MKTILQKLKDIISPKEQVSKTEKRIKDQLESGTQVVDVKVDLLQYMRQQQRAKTNQLKVNHKFHFEDIGEQDCLLLQVPNINESGYYSGIVALRTYINKFHPDLKVEIIDPVIDYFFFI